MSEPIAPNALAVGLLLLTVPLAYALAAALPTRSTTVRITLARAAGAAAFALALASGLAFAFEGEVVSHLLRLPLPGLTDVALSTRLDLLTIAMLGLVSFIALVVLHFSRAYLDGDPGQGRYVRWLMATLAAVALLVVSNNLLVIALAWMATSLALHQLLTFYGHRPQALIAAHKKFLVSRLADVCVLGAVGLIGSSLGTLEIDALRDRLGSLTTYPPALAAACLLIVAGVSLKSAQLPFHGWLLQMMEAPTPVSALLHAGVVNIGGFVLIRLAPLLASEELAQTALVVIGSTTAAVAGLVMITRVSVKVALSWSTCAQMGFMLVECGLGAYQLALLHLIGHSLYKAHAFLRSGSVVAEWRAHASSTRPKRVGLGTWFASGGVALAIVTAIVFGSGLDPRTEPALYAFVPIVSAGLTPLVVRAASAGGRRTVILALTSLAVATLYFTWHGLFSHAVLPAVGSQAVAPHRLAIVLLAFGAQFVVHALMQSRPDGRLAQVLHRNLFAGLYLDEIFTRLTFRVWPARVSAKTSNASPLYAGQEAGTWRA